jgi:predicted AAA+ superfamily ATPase
MSEWMLDTPDKFVNRGKLAEMLVGLEVLKAGSPFVENHLYYWHREAKSSNAEVDYIVQIGNAIVPIEVKSGRKGSMKSMRIMMGEKRLSVGVRTSEENLGAIGEVRIVPLYLIGESTRLLQEEIRGRQSP